MSLNHIIYDSVPDNEKLDVKFKNVYCDQVITGSGPGPEPVTGDGYVDALAGTAISSPTTGVNAPSGLNFATCIKNHSTFIWTFKAEVNLTLNLSAFSLDVTIPTAMKSYFDANPTAFQNIYTSVTGTAHSTAASPDFRANMLYYPSATSLLSSSTVRLFMLSFANNGTGTIPINTTLQVQLIFSGPV